MTPLQRQRNWVTRSEDGVDDDAQIEDEEGQGASPAEVLLQPKP